MRNGQLVTVNEYGQTMEEANAPENWQNGAYVGPAVTNTEQVNGGANTTYANGWQQFVPGVQQTPITTGTPQPTTPAITYNPDGTRVLTNTEQQTADYWAARQPRTPAQIATENERIRQEHLAQQQAEIDTINQMYAGILSQIDRDNQGRLGSSYNIQALTGERGSYTGDADIRKTTDANAEIKNAKIAEKTAKITQIMNNYQSEIDDEILKATELRTKDADAWIEYQKGEVDRARTQSTELRARFLAAGMKATDIDEGTWQKIADAGGYTIDQAKALYNSEYSAQQKAFLEGEAAKTAAAEKARLENEKTIAETGKIGAETKAQTEQKERLMIQEGYVYMSTPAIRDRYARKGRVMATVNGRTYMAPIEKDPNKSSSNTSTSKQNENEMNAALASLAGLDGFVSPETYVQLRKAWINDGENPTTFDTKFKGFRNPANKNYVVSADVTI